MVCSCTVYRVSSLKKRMLIFTLDLLLLIQLWTTVKSDCGAPPSINLTCGHNQVNASWDSGGCAHSLCKGYLNCTNGIGSPYLSETHDATCYSTFEFLNIPMDYYYCTVTVHYRYLDDDYDILQSPDTKEACAYNKIEIQDNYFKNLTVGNYHEVYCQVYTGKAMSSSEMNISWTGLDGVIANESDRITVHSTTSDGHIHTSTLQFSYISEEDKNVAYNCIASLSGENKALSESFTMTKLTIPKPTITLTGTGNQTVGDELSLRCDVNLSKGISGSVNFVWKINNTEVELHNMSFPLSNTSALYTDFLNISSLNLTDNNAVYQCQAEIVTSHSVNLTVSINLTLNVTETSSTSSNPQATATPTSLIIIILSAVLIFAVIGLIIGIFVSCHQKWKRLLLNAFKRARRDRSREGIQIRIPDIDDNDYSVIGKDDPSTVEYLKYDRIARSKDGMPKIDEECNSIDLMSDFVTNEEMLTCVYGSSTSKKQHFKAMKLDNGYYSDTSMSPKDLPVTLNGDTNHLHSDPSGDYVQSSPYVEDTIALHQQNLSSFIDPPYTSLSQMQDPPMVPSTSNDNPPTLANEGEYVADGMMIEQCGSSIDVTSVDLGYLDYNAAINQNNAKETASYSAVAGANMIFHKPSSECNSFPYVRLSEDLMSSMHSDQFGSSCIEHGETGEMNDFPSLHTATVTDIQVAEDANSFITPQKSGTEQMINVTDQALSHKTTTNSSIDLECMEENNDGSYISE